MVRANSTCLADKLPSGFSVSCWPRIRMLLSGVRSSCDMLARNSDLYFEVSESSVAFSSSARRACSISWFLLCLQLSGELLGLLQQTFGLHGGFDTVEHDADAVGELFEEGHLRRREGADGGQLDHGFDLVLEQDRKHHA